MLQFKPITLKDEAAIRLYLSFSTSKQLVNCFEAFYLWRDVLRIEWAKMGETAFFKVHYRSGTPQFLFPFGGENPADTIRELKNYCMSEGIPLSLAKVGSDQLAFLRNHFFGEVVWSSSRDHAEYLYETEKFRTYSGAGLQPKRNFVNYARRNFDWLYEPVAPANLDECREFASGFGGGEGLEDDTEALQTALSEYGSLHLSGGVIRVDGRISALFVCTMLEDNQTAGGLFLRGDHGKKGVIPLLFQLFFQHHPEFRYFNFGEDLGIEGLRKNKLSFQPMELLELYDVDFT